jgi:hypothetical protein
MKTSSIIVLVKLREREQTNKAMAVMQIASRKHSNGVKPIA